jgi:hypothetical protein
MGLFRLDQSDEVPNRQPRRSATDCRASDFPQENTAP